MKNAEIHLGYFKRGDDLAHFLKDAAPREALLQHAESMDMVAAHLRAIAEVIGDATVEMTADVHFITIAGPDDVIDKLVALELACEEEPWEDDEDDVTEGEDDSEFGADLEESV